MTQRISSAHTVAAAATGGHHGFDLAGRGARDKLERMALTDTLPAVTSASFAAEVLEADRPVLVDFTAAWCPPCRAMKPVLDAIAADRDDLRIVQVDVDREQALAVEHGVLSMPTFVLFRDGREVQRLVGARPRRRLEAEIDAAL